MNCAKIISELYGSLSLVMYEFLLSFYFWFSLFHLLQYEAITSFFSYVAAKTCQLSSLTQEENV